MNHFQFVIPADAGIHMVMNDDGLQYGGFLDSSVRWNDEVG